MTDTLKIAIAQINPHVGAIDKNLAAIRAARAKAAATGRRPRGHAGTLHLRLPARGPGAQTRLRRRLRSRRRGRWRATPPMAAPA